MLGCESILPRIPMPSELSRLTRRFIPSNSPQFLGRSFAPHKMIQAHLRTFLVLTLLTIASAAVTDKSQEAFPVAAELDSSRRTRRRP